MRDDVDNIDIGERRTGVGFDVLSGFEEINFEPSAIVNPDFPNADRSIGIDRCF